MSDALYHQAQHALSEGDLEQAATCLEAFVAQTPLPRLGGFYSDLTAFLQQGVQSKTDQSWEQSPALRARIQLAQLYWSQQRHAVALQQLTWLLDEMPAAALFHLLGRWHFELQAHEAAAVAWLEALRLNPAYLPAYEDLATLANLNGDSDLAYQLIQRALPYGLSSRLLEELMLACSREAYIPMRTLFIELCVQQIRSETLPLLLSLLQSLYDQADWHHATYLGFHLNQVFPDEPHALRLYVLSALQQQQYGPALQALYRVPARFFDDGAHWFQLAVVYSQWQMPHFAHYALKTAARLEPALTPLVQVRQQALPEASQDLLAEIIRQLMVSPAFKAALQQAPARTLKEWDIQPRSALLKALKPLLAQKSDGP
ncbi:MAG: hypothetical protein IGS03_04565 [Candidatus Sericytochromatia bacterium]|nr:hypothetical protein [Candidatus Sericytochromatia bacterium]